MQMKDSSVRRIGQVFIVAVWLAAAVLVFSDALFHLAGSSASKIYHFDPSRLTFVRNDRISFGGPGIHYKDVTFYKTQEGNQIAVFQSNKTPEKGLFLRGKHKIYHTTGYDEIVTYEPFVLWPYALKRCAVLFILSVMILAAAGFVLKLFTARLNLRVS